MDGAARLFVYGTLVPDGQLWPVLAPYAVSWERTTARGGLWDTGRGYPAARFDDTGGRVPGFLVALDQVRLTEAVAVLDRIEDEGRLFRRVEIATSHGPAMAYEWLGATEDLAQLDGGWFPSA